MKYRTFTSKGLVLYTLFTPSIIFFTPVVFISLMDQTSGVKNLLIILFLHLIANLLLLLYFHKGFSIVSMDTEGIRMNSICLKWNEIGSINTQEIELLKYSLIPTIRITLLCISANKESSSSWTSAKDCILISSSKKNLQMLAKYSSGSSKILDDYISSMHLQ